MRSEGGVSVEARLPDTAFGLPTPEVGITLRLHRANDWLLSGHGGRAESSASPVHDLRIAVAQIFLFRLTVTRHR
jgi:hypothetical protein